ncbi:MAG: hypothetical protein QXM16_03735 [Nitrososphaerota archaeon]
MELNLLLRSGEIIVASVPEFYETLSNLLRFRMIETYPLKAEYHCESFILRSKYGTLTYFDSLHAAVAIIENLTLVSYDRICAGLTEVKYIHHEDYRG